MRPDRRRRVVRGLVVLLPLVVGLLAPVTMVALRDHAPAEAPSQAPVAPPPQAQSAPPAITLPAPPAPPAPAPPRSAASVLRLSGADRVATAVAISRQVAAAAVTVVVVGQDEYADALSGAPLAAALGAPMLLTARDGLSAVTADEVVRLGAQRAVLLGGEAALSEAVAGELTALGLEVERIAGASRFATAAAVAAHLPPADEVFVAEGAHADPLRGWPDALSAAALAAALQRPLLLTAGDELPVESLEAIPAGADVTIVGGEDAVGPAVASALQDVGEVRRLAGATRYDTSAAVAEEWLARGNDLSGIWLATGRAFPDALVAAAAAGQSAGLLLLLDGLDVAGSPATRGWLADHATQVDDVLLVGGPLVISPTVEDDVRALVAGDPAPTAAPGASRCPAFPAFPDAACTGVLPGIARATTGSFTTTTDGQVIANLDVNGTITIAHDNVTISNVRFRSAGQAINNLGHTGLLVEDCEIDGSGAPDAASAIGEHNYTMRRCNIHHVGEGPRINGNVVLEDNYLHDFLDFIAQGAHQDCIQITSGSHIVIRHNTCMLQVDGANAAIMTGTDSGSDLEFQHNLLAGGGFTVYCGAHTGYTDVRVLDNHFSTLYYPMGGYHGPLVYCDGPGHVVAGNVWHDGPNSGQPLG